MIITLMTNQPILKEMVEILFSKGLVKILFATEVRYIL